MIYFIRTATDPFVKIGTAKDPLRRFGSFQGGNHRRLELLAVIPGSYAQERALHELFIEYHERGEWFRLTGTLKRYIATLPPASLYRRMRKTFDKIEYDPEAPALHPKGHGRGMEAVATRRCFGEEDRGRFWRIAANGLRLHALGKKAEAQT